MDSSSSSNSCLSVGSTSPGAVVLLYSVGAQGNEARGGPERRPPSPSPGFLRTSTSGPKEGVPTSRRRALVVDLVSQATVYRCMCKWCVLLEVSTVTVPLAPSHSFLLFPSTRHRAFRKPLVQDGGVRIGGSRCLARACRATFWANLRNLLVLSSLIQSACGSSPRRPCTAPTFLAEKYLACTWA